MYGGGEVFWKSQALTLCLAQFTTKLWLGGAPSAYWVLHYLPQSATSIIPLTEYSMEVIFAV